MSTVITVAINTGFTSIINPFLPITHLSKKQSILRFLAAKQKIFHKTNKQKYQNNIFFHSLKILSLFHALGKNWYHKRSGI